MEGSIQVDSNRLEDVLNDYYKEKAEKYGDFSLITSFFSFQIKSVIAQLNLEHHPVKIHV